MRAKSIRVLMVEDSEDDAYLVERVLRQSGFEPDCRRVDTYEEMKEALRDGGWDVVVSDYLMPQFNGLGALQLCRDAGLDIPFVLVSGSIGEDAAVQAMKIGVQDYLMKDNLTRLPATIERELREAKNRRERREMANALSNALRDSLQSVKRSCEAALSDTAGDAGFGRNHLLQACEAADRGLDIIDRLRSGEQLTAQAE